MKNSRLSSPFGANERTIEILALLLLLFMVIYSVWQFGLLPEAIPSHFNRKGEADAWGNKTAVFIVPGIAVFTYLLIYFVSKVSPENYNYPVKITEENKAYQYALGKLVLKTINFWCMLLMAFITWGGIQVALGHSGAMNLIILWSLIGGLFVVLGWYIWAAKKAA
jgi:uncharacterized membrane protein